MPPLTYGETVIQYVRLGAPLHLAAKAAGIGESTLHAWKAAGARKKNPDRRYREFLEAVQKAEAESIMRALAAIREAALGDEYEIRKTVEKPVRGADGEVRMVRETTTTRGRKRHWQAAAWLSERRATADFGRARVWKDLIPPAEEPVAPGDEELAGAEAALLSAIDSYLVGRADGLAEAAGVERAPDG